MLLDLAMPVAKRVQNSMNALTAKPESTTNAEKKRLAMPTIGTRRTRSASQPIGTAPSTKNADDAVPMKTMAPLLMWKVARISGPSTWIAAPSSSSNASSSPSTMNMSFPPRANASRNVTGSELTPGRRSSGKITCSDARACASWRAASSSSTADARTAASPRVCCVSSTCPPAVLLAGDVLDRGDGLPVPVRGDGRVELFQAEVVLGVVLPGVQGRVRPRAAVRDRAEPVDGLDPGGVVQVLADLLADVVEHGHRLAGVVDQTVRVECLPTRRRQELGGLRRGLPDVFLVDRGAVGPVRALVVLGGGRS